MWSTIVDRTPCLEDREESGIQGLRETAMQDSC